MSTRRVKNIDYDDDDGFDSYDEDYGADDNEDQNDITEDDKFQMQEGTAKVKSLLGSQIVVTDKEIQDALWHYYYDVEKSVAYLKNIKKPAPQVQKTVKTSTSQGESYCSCFQCSLAHLHPTVHNLGCFNLRRSNAASFGIFCSLRLQGLFQRHAMGKRTAFKTVQHVSHECDASWQTARRLIQAGRSCCCT